MNGFPFPVLPAANHGKWFPRLVATSACVAALLLLNGAAASGDPIRIVTSGLIDQLPQDNETGFNFIGTGFQIGGGEVYWTPVAMCDPCTPGSSVNLSATITPRVFPPGSAAIDGHTYDNVFFRGRFMANAGSVAVPNFAAGVEDWSAATWFTLTGTLSGYADSTFTGTPLFSTRLAGRGRAMLAFLNDGNNTTVDAFRYQFTNAAPTPEPSTLFLFVPGAAWMFGQLRNRRRTTAKV